MTLPTCCQYHAAKLPKEGCREGRNCPERVIDPLLLRVLARIERWGKWLLAGIAVAAWWLYANWPMLRWALLP